MTINGLWKTLGESCCRQVDMRKDIVNKRLAVDLSAWIVEASTSPSLQRIHKNPHLYLVFSRALWLRKLDCTVFYIIEDAEACRLKTTIPRLRLDRMGRECETVLAGLGCVCIRAPPGIEAEAITAVLNAEKIVDSVVTADGDAFAYAAESVICDLKQDSIKAKRTHIFEARQHEVFGVFDTQRSIIAFALLTGSDLSPGLPGIGPERAVRFLKFCNLLLALGKTQLDALDIMRAWRDSLSLPEIESEFDAVAETIQRHCLSSSSTFPSETVIDTFLKEPRYFICNYFAPLDSFTQKTERRTNIKALQEANASTIVFGGLSSTFKASQQAASWAYIARTLRAKPSRLDEYDDAPFYS